MSEKKGLKISLLFVTILFLGACTFEATATKKKQISSNSPADEISETLVNQINQNNVTFQGGCTTSGANYTLSLSEVLTSTVLCQEDNTWSANLDVSDLPDGNITVSLRSSEGNTLKTVNLVKDTTPPSDPSGLTHDSWSSITTESPVLSWTASTDVGSGISKYMVRIIRNLDSSVFVDWQELESGGQITNISLVLGESYKYEVKALDVASNASNSIQSSTWLISLPNSIGFSGNSRLTATALLRSFSELSSPAWSLTGTCNPTQGDVVISGDLDSSISVSCSNAGAGTFSLDINNLNSSVSPHFQVEISSPLKMGRTLIATQGSSSAETEVFETSSASPPLYVSDYSTFKNAPDSSIMILEADIDLSNGGTIVGDNWSNTEFGTTFSGIIEGNGKKIINLNASISSSASLLATQDGVVRNINMEAVYLSAPGAIAPQKIGGIAAINQGLIEKITISGTLHSTQAASYVGGITAINNGYIKGVSVNVAITGNGNYVGGIAAKASGLYGLIGTQKCHVEGSFTGANVVGGIVGDLGGDVMHGTAIVENCLNEATLNGVTVGGIAGYLSSSYNLIKKSLNVGSITASANGGRLYGAYTGGYTLMFSYVKSTGTCSGCTNTDGGSLSDVSLLNTSSYFNWDFVNEWIMTTSKGFPIPIL